MLTTSFRRQNNKKTTFRLRPQTDFIRLVSSKLVLWGASCRQGRPFRPIFEKTNNLCCTLHKLKKPARKVGGEAANFWCPSFEFWRGGTRSRIVLRTCERSEPATPSENFRQAMKNIRQVAKRTLGRPKARQNEIQKKG